MEESKTKPEIEDKTTTEWLNSQKKATRAHYTTWWNKFLEFTGLTGDEILASKRVAEEGTWEKKVMAFKGWLLTEKKLSSYSATAATMAACSFFSYYRQALQFRRSESTRIGERNRTTEDYRFSIEDFAKMFAVTDLEEKYALTAGKSFGLRAGDFLRMARGDLEAYIDREPPISIGEYKTQKESVRAFPFVDTDAQPVIKLMLEKMTREGKTKPNDRMLPYRNEIQLSRVLKRIIVKAGINVGSKEVRFHCLRKFLIDHISCYMSESKWKQIVGKAITEGAYVSPDSLREDYARAMPETTFGKRKEEDVQKVAKLEALKLFAKVSGYTVEDIARIRMRKPKVNVDEEIEEIEKMMAEKEHKDDACTDGEHCGEEFKQIGETLLLEHLKAGWKITHNLANGQVIVQR